MATYYYIGGTTGRMATASDWSATNGGTALSSITWVYGDTAQIDSDASVDMTTTKTNNTPVNLIANANVTLTGTDSTYYEIFITGLTVGAGKSVSGLQCTVNYSGAFTFPLNLGAGATVAQINACCLGGTASFTPTGSVVSTATVTLFCADNHTYSTANSVCDVTLPNCSIGTLQISTYSTTYTIDVTLLVPANADWSTLDVSKGTARVAAKRLEYFENKTLSSTLQLIGSWTEIIIDDGVTVTGEMTARASREAANVPFSLGAGAKLNGTLTYDNGSGACTFSWTGTVDSTAEIAKVMHPGGSTNYAVRINLPGCKVGIDTGKEGTKSSASTYIVPDATVFTKFVHSLVFTKPVTLQRTNSGTIKLVGSAYFCNVTTSNVIALELSGNAAQVIQSPNVSSGMGWDPDVPILLNKTNGSVSLTQYAVTANTAHDTLLLSGQCPEITLCDTTNLTNVSGSVNVASIGPIKLVADITCNSLVLADGVSSAYPTKVQIPSGHTLQSGGTTWGTNCLIDGADSTYGTYCSPCTNGVPNDSTDANYNVAAGISKTCLITAEQLDTPTNVKATFHTDSITITFSSVANASSYTLQSTTVANNGVPDWTDATLTTAFSSGDSVSTSHWNTVYCRVKAVGDNINYTDSDWSAVVRDHGTIDDGSGGTATVGPIFTVTEATAASLSSVTVTPGQLIVCTDTATMYVDTSTSVRKQIII